MLNVDEALKIVLSEATPREPVPMRLGPDLLGHVLARSVQSDIDSPPFDKAMMDGVAVRTADFRDGRAEFEVIEEITAGRMPTKRVGAGQTSRIMTGAAIPEGVDAVVMIENVQVVGPNRVSVQEARIKPGLNILRRGREMQAGQAVLGASRRLRPQELGLLAAAGAANVFVRPAPRISLLATGDELVGVDVAPGPGQIRNSNGPMLLGQTVRAGAKIASADTANDNEEDLLTKIQAGLGADILVLSGGVSAGKLDLVPGVLQKLQVVPKFHKIRMKPGKPLFFGVREPGDDRPATLVFGLPGNPVSSFVGFELFVRPAVRQMMGLPAGPSYAMAELAEGLVHRSDRPTYHPVRWTSEGATRRVRVMPWFGSPDLRGICEADAFAVLAEGERTYEAGQEVTVMVMDE